MGRKPIKKKRTEDPARKKEWVKQVMPAFLSRGIKGLSMDEVSEILGVSKATLYKHFSSREEILEQILIHLINNIKKFEERLSDKKVPFLERYFEAVAILVANTAVISTTFLADLKLLYPSIWEHANAFKQYALVVLQQFYQQGIDDGVFRDIDASIYVLSDKMFFEALTDPFELEQLKLNMGEAFKLYFTSRCFGMINEGNENKNSKEKLSKLIDEFKVSQFENLSFD